MAKKVLKNFKQLNKFQNPKEEKVEGKSSNKAEESIEVVKPFKGSLKSATDSMKCKSCGKVGCTNC